MSKPLPESIKQQIQKDADRYCQIKTPSALSAEAWKAFIAGAESLGIQYLAEKERADQLEKEHNILCAQRDHALNECVNLERWKTEATEVMAPLFEWGQKNAPLGVRIHQFILERLEAYERMEAALKEIQLAVHQEDDLNGFREWIKKQANEALSTQTDNKTENI